MRRLLQTSTLALSLLLSSSAPRGEETATDQRPTARFRAEHREVKEHLRHVEEWVGALRTQSPAERRKTAEKVVSFFEKHIEPHAEWEEQHLYPVVDTLAGGGPNAFTSSMRYEYRVVGAPPAHRPAGPPTGARLRPAPRLFAS